MCIGFIVMLVVAKMLHISGMLFYNNMSHSVNI